MWQLSMQTDDPLMREIGSAIIGNLDDDGYLVASFEELAEMGSWPVADVERALRLVQGFDPVGVAARDLQECLLLQLRHLGLEGTPTEKVVTDHLRLLQNHQVPEIARKLGLTASTTSRNTSRSSATSIRSPAAGTTRRSRSTSSPTCTSSRSRISTSRC